MKKMALILGIATFILFQAPVSAQAASSAEMTYHSDYRGTPKLMLNVGFSTWKPTSLKETSKRYLVENASTFEIENVEENLRYNQTQHSLNAIHIRYQQIGADGIEVLGGEVVVSISKDSNEVYRVFNNFFPGQEEVETSLVSSELAYDTAWKDLKAHGDVLEQPLNRLKYTVDSEGKFRLVRITLINLSAPMGAWEHIIDARTGKLISRKDTRIERKKTNSNRRVESYVGEISNRRRAFDAYAAKISLRQEVGTIKRLSGSGLVFDPDPRTTTGIFDLTDTSDESLFDAAYFDRELKEIAFVDGVYRLDGPWIKIIDFEAPETAPSTSETGTWTAKRGDNSFNDSMTYFHIDQNQRYMQSLGFVGEAGIQNTPIEVDTDGVNGDDNSHFIPTSNRLAFGHGCVDDNEDVDVILHEYGHAINFWINNSWSGGDTGAMGEGFGDYWAASYSISTENGLTFESFRVYTWDGGEGCWLGRRLDVLEAKYDHLENYRAHAPILGGFQSDELWSTPVFQSLMALLDLGVDRRDVDKIVLQSQFGLGAGLKMRDMAKAIIQTANRLYPEGPHAEVFRAKFTHHDIIGDPEADLILKSIQVEGENNDNQNTPGETLKVKIPLLNRGDAKADLITATLTSFDNTVEVTYAQSTYPAIDGLGGTGVNQAAFGAKIAADHVCGVPLAFEVNLKYNAFEAADAEMKESVFAFEVATGTPSAFLDQVNEEEMAIPDEDFNGISSSLIVTDSGKVTHDFGVYVKIDHTYIGDVVITLISPTGTSVILFHKPELASGGVMEGYFGIDLESKEDLRLFLGTDLAGEWKLEVLDIVKEDTGKLVSWGLKSVTAYECI